MFLPRVGYFGLLNVMTLKDILGGYSDKVPPLPIPNREVKLVRADGTAFSGRVGRRRILKIPGSAKSRGFLRLCGFCPRIESCPRIEDRRSQLRELRESKIEAVN